MIFIGYTFDGNCKTLHSNDEIIDFFQQMFQRLIHPMKIIFRTIVPFVKPEHKARAMGSLISPIWSI